MHIFDLVKETKITHIMHGELSVYIMIFGTQLHIGVQKPEEGQNMAHVLGSPRKILSGLHKCSVIYMTTSSSSSSSSVFPSQMLLHHCI
jgi:hypothetical protein